MRRGIVLIALALLLVGLSAGRAARSQTVSSYGITIAVPAGWHARVFRGAFALSTKRISDSRDPSAASRHLRRDEVTVLLFEDTNDSAWSPGLDPGTYRTGQPRPFAESELNDSNGPRRNFELAGRLFDLFVSKGSKTLSGQRLVQLNDVVDSIRVQPGDFYPGRVAPARFRPARGWIVRHQGSLDVGTDNYVDTVASTVPWSDALNNSVPTRSLGRLRRADGVAILVSLEADNRFLPAPRSAPLRLGHLGIGWATCGPTIPGVSTQPGTAAVGREYGYSVDVVYGSVHPTPQQRAFARAELARLVLPRWPRWP